ncbi:MAG: hypothetical protein JEZ02_01065 [Desulfatibacillum sp.]|nr:hypothetical protein [Desulfatibacillum sp.]
MKTLQNEKVVHMNREGLLISERIHEVTWICSREHPIYEQISNYSIALYVIGYLRSPDLMSCDDIGQSEASNILEEYFTEIPEERLPLEYDITCAEDKYLVVFGEKAFPVHFAVLADTESASPYFSKLDFLGCGFDSMEELKNDYLKKDGVHGEIHFFKMNKASSVQDSCRGKIYILKNDGSYSVFEEDNNQKNARRVNRVNY